MLLHPHALLVLNISEGNISKTPWTVIYLSLFIEQVIYFSISATQLLIIRFSKQYCGKFCEFTGSYLTNSDTVMFK